jgi:hypothetical protein
MGWVQTAAWWTQCMFNLKETRSYVLEHIASPLGVNMNHWVGLGHFVAEPLTRLTLTRPHVTWPEQVPLPFNVCNSCVHRYKFNHTYCSIGVPATTWTTSQSSRTVRCLSACL